MRAASKQEPPLDVGSHVEGKEEKKCRRESESERERVEHARLGGFSLRGGLSATEGREKA